MNLCDELNLKTGFSVLAHEAILNVYFTASLMKKRADEFFKSFGITDVQFNVLMLLNYQSSGNKGLSQAQLSRMMLVNRANITSLVDRMEKAELVQRTSLSNDRRYNIVKMTDKGRQIFQEVEPLYTRMVKEVMQNLSPDEHNKLISMLTEIRGQINKV
jgi:DNA-binding MarR family transcriptional regulator